MKQFVRITAMALAVLFFVTENAYAQNDKSKRPSPPDQVSATIDAATVTIDYSQPSVKGRDIFGGLIPYGNIWRTGANEASWIEVSADVKIQGKDLPKGKYGLYTVPGEKEWTIVFSKNWEHWGTAYSGEENDALRVTAKSGSTTATEKLTISIDGNTVSIAWDKTKVDFKIKG